MGTRVYGLNNTWRHYKLVNNSEYINKHWPHSCEITHFPLQQQKRLRTLLKWNYFICLVQVWQVTNFWWCWFNINPEKYINKRAATWNIVIKWLSWIGSRYSLLKHFKLFINQFWADDRGEVQSVSRFQRHEFGSLEKVILV